MPQVQVTFDAADDYERVMGQWSRLIGERFLDWLAPAPGQRWLDIGCGTGAFSRLIAERCAPQSLSGIDPSAAQIAFARSTLPDADMRVADSMALPFGDGEFDVVASALVLHFIPDRGKAFAEMKRVARRGGVVAAYTWERTPESSGAPYAPMLGGIRSMGLEPLRSPTVPEQTLEGLRASAGAAGFSDIEVSRIEAVRSFSNFDDYWHVQTLTVAPIGKMVAGLDCAQRERLRETMRSIVPIAADGSISYPARAVAFKART